MAYLALYREWRPKNFKEIVGQEHVRTILTNALLQNRVAHAYLFSGPRGTGKTTAAKILAKALNCTNRNGAEPCNQCTSCQEIDQGLALDVLEIDAASNRGIDEIRDLREKVKLASSGGKYKVYIIDEVHMLTTEAFNALLKTLEEPPASVVFVLATTEAHKVPLTILSRVQRFEFHRISPAGILQRLQEVCQALGRDVENKALQVIAAKAEGGLRDALSILDQCLLQDDPILAEHVYQVIGMVGETYSADLTDALLEGDYGRALAKLGEGTALGRDPRQIIRELLEYLRQALLYTAGGQEPLLSPDVRERLIEQSKKAGLSKILSWLNILLKGEGELRYASNGRLAAEMILVQALYGQENASETQNQTNDIRTIDKTQKAGKPDQGNILNEHPDQVIGKQVVANIKAADTGHVTDDKQKNNPNTEIEAKTVNEEMQDEALWPELKRKWPDILEEVKRKKKSTHAFLLEGKPAAMKNQMLYLVFKEGYSFHKDKCSQPENKLVIEEVTGHILGQKITIQSLMENEYSTKKEANSVSESSIKEDEDENCVEKAVELFGAQLVHVHKDE